MWSTRTSATRRRSSVRSGWTIPPEDGAARDTQRVVQALSSSPSGPAGSVDRQTPQDGPQPFNLAPGVRGCGPAPTSAMVPFDRVFPTRSYGGLTAVPGSCAAARTRRTNFASRVSRGTSAVAHIGLAAGHHLHVLGVGSTARSSGPSEFPPRRETHALWQLLSVLASRQILPGTG